jgi:hypothetical protein
LEHTFYQRQTALSTGPDPEDGIPGVCPLLVNKSLKLTLELENIAEIDDEFSWNVWALALCPRPGSAAPDQ